MHTEISEAITLQTYKIIGDMLANRTDFLAPNIAETLILRGWKLAHGRSDSDADMQIWEKNNRQLTASAALHEEFLFAMQYINYLTMAKENN